MTTKLMEEILNKENLETAMKAVIANKGSAGVDGMKINELPKFIEEHGEEITERIRMRMCIWKQWKTSQRREWGLRKIGMNTFWAHVNANSRKGIMAIASSGIMNNTVTNAVLKRKGLLSLADNYQLVHSY